MIFTKLTTKLAKQSPWNKWDKLGALLPGSKFLQFARMYRQNLQKNISEQLGQNRDSSFRKPSFTCFTKLTMKLLKQSPRNNWHKIVTLLSGSKSLHECTAKIYGKTSQNNWDKIGTVCLENRFSLFPRSWPRNWWSNLLEIIGTKQGHFSQEANLCTNVLTRLTENHLRTIGTK